jgi:hypothetical protein
MTSRRSDGPAPLRDDAKRGKSAGLGTVCRETHACDAKRGKSAGLGTVCRETHAGAD